MKSFNAVTWRLIAARSYRPQECFGASKIERASEGSCPNALPTARIEISLWRFLKTMRRWEQLDEFATVREVSGSQPQQPSKGEIEADMRVTDPRLARQTLEHS